MNSEENTKGKSKRAARVNAEELKANVMQSLQAGDIHAAMLVTGLPQVVISDGADYSVPVLAGFDYIVLAIDRREDAPQQIAVVPLE